MLLSRHHPLDATALDLWKLHVLRQIRTKNATSRRLRRSFDKMPDYDVSASLDKLLATPWDSVRAVVRFITFLAVHVRNDGAVFGKSRLEQRDGKINAIMSL